jgi:hypothetical protein
MKFTKRRVLTEQLAEKLVKYIKKELDYLFGLNYQKEVYLQKSLLIRFYKRSLFIAPGTIFGSNGERDISDLHYV